MALSVLSKRLVVSHSELVQSAGARFAHPPPVRIHLDLVCNRGIIDPRPRRRAVSDMTSEQMKEELERLRTENEALKKRSEEGLSLKVSQKGGVSVYGLGRFPVTLYKEQWEKLLDISDDIRTFIQENEPQLKTKGS